RDVCGDEHRRDAEADLLEHARDLGRRVGARLVQGLRIDAQRLPAQAPVARDRRAERGPSGEGDRPTGGGPGAPRRLLAPPAIVLAGLAGSPALPRPRALAPSAR